MDFARPGNEHWYVLLVCSVPIAQDFYQVIFLQTNRDQDIDSQSASKKQVAHRHVWGCPQTNEHPGIEGVPDKAVEKYHLELWILVDSTDELQVDLS